MRHVYKSEQWLPYPVEIVFNFFANPENLPRLMPAWQDARIERSTFAAPPPNPNRHQSAMVAAGAGTRMTLSFRPFPFSPIRVPWDAEISEFAWNEHFCDIQHRGPFAYWRHCHRLEAMPRDRIAGTLLRDHVEYELPLGALGDLTNALFVGRQMKYIFDYRHRQTAELLAGGASDSKD